MVRLALVSILIAVQSVQALATADDTAQCVADDATGARCESSADDDDSVTMLQKKKKTAAHHEAGARPGIAARHHAELSWRTLAESMQADARAQAETDASHDRLPLIPYPASVEFDTGGVFWLSKDCAVDIDDAIPENDFAVQLLLRHVGKAVIDHSDCNILVDLSHGSEHGPESYSLKVEANKMELRAGSSAGLFYGVQTLRQLTGTHQPTAALTILDAPRFEWRGLQIDVSRHFFSGLEIKRLIDTMSTYKLNRLHLHLTDDQGWRVPITDYPLLCTVGATDSSGVAKSYTVEEINDIINYARERHVEVLPEVDVPGHAAAAIAAYPELGNTDVPNFHAPSGPLRTWGEHEYTLGLSSDTMDFLGTVFSRVAELFPSQFVHIGGDEAPTRQWMQSVSARGKQTQGVFNKILSDILAQKNKTIIAWDEAQHMPGLPQDAIIMAWRSTNELRQAVALGRRVINADQSSLYFDHYQGAESKEPKAICCFAPLSQVYNYDPMPAGLTHDAQKLVIGAQAQLWSEYIPTWNHLEYMAHPRSIALAERVWTPNKQINSFQDFRKRLVVRLSDLDDLGANYRALDA